MTYNQYAYVEAFLDMKQKSWITAHVHMYEFFGGVARILVPNNCKTATVQFNYHISVDGMLYSVPYEYIKKKVDVKVTDTTIEIFYNHNRIASHRRLKGRPGQYSTITEHMPEDHQKYLE